ncbi:anti-sigma F factor antagonist [Flavonifractor sp. An82]|uniref:STAS domain-containing protein n=1 Tax=Flavonifractor sp. An82 TaxID=1965660 RepID=UPI000B371C7D|nr:STAS domain-containing protein [Flavonifractor sp. An82]OUN23993.1 anti-sigma F factor antagonist [Flavonifractor sp. An82]
MEIIKERNGNDLVLKLQGRLDTTTAPELEQELKNSLPGVQALTIDMEGLEYISSAGLRVVLFAQKTMNRQGSMVVRGAGPMIMEVFDITGFSDILNIQ